MWVIKDKGGRTGEGRQVRKEGEERREEQQMRLDS